MNQDNRIGEVVESSSLQFTVQCYDLYKSPNIGTLVKCGTDPQLFGICLLYTSPSPRDS